MSELDILSFVSNEKGHWTEKNIIKKTKDFSDKTKKQHVR